MCFLFVILETTLLYIYSLTFKSQVLLFFSFTEWNASIVNVTHVLNFSRKTVKIYFIVFWLCTNFMEYTYLLLFWIHLFFNNKIHDCNLLHSVQCACTIKNWNNTQIFVPCLSGTKLVLELPYKAGWGCLKSFLCLRPFI